MTVLAAVPLAVGGAARAASAWTEASSLHSAVWSPDGSRIAFVHAIERQPDRATSALYLVRADRSSRRRLAVLDGRIHGLTWSQRGDRLAFVGGNPDRASVRVVRPDGWLIAEIVGASDFDWAPDGRRLVVLEILSRRGAALRGLGRRRDWETVAQRRRGFCAGLVVQRKLDRVRGACTGAV